MMAGKSRGRVSISIKPETYTLLLEIRLLLRRRGVRKHNYEIVHEALELYKEKLVGGGENG